MSDSFQADVIIVGAGLAGMVAAHEAVLRGRKVLLLDQEAPQSLGGQAFWSLGGLMMVDTPEQRRMKINDSHDLALSDWMGSAQFDRRQDEWPRRWATAYVDFCAGEMRAMLHKLGMRWFPGAAMALIVIAGLSLQWSPLYSIEYAMHGLLSRLGQSTTPQEDIVMVAIDDNTVSKLGTHTPPRSVMSGLKPRLSRS